MPSFPSNTVVDRNDHILAPLDAARWDSVLSVDRDNRSPTASAAVPGRLTDSVVARPFVLLEMIFTSLGLFRARSA